MNRYTTACMLILAALFTPAGVAFGADDATYLNEDAHISGKVIYAFTDEPRGETVSVILDDFKLTVGPEGNQYVLTGRDGVVWVKNVKLESGSGSEITIYIEGGAKIVEPGGASTQDKTLLVKLYQQGRITATGRMSNTPQTQFPLFQRASQARNKKAVEKEDDRVHAPPELLTQSQPTSRPAVTSAPIAKTDVMDKLIASQPTSGPAAEPVAVAVAEGKKDQPAEPSPSARPGDDTKDIIKEVSTVDITAPKSQGKESADKSAYTDAVTVSPREAVSIAREDTPIKPVNFYADSVTSEEKDGQRITYARGKVYLSQGEFDSDNVLELRAENAVIITGPSTPGVKKERTPYSGAVNQSGSQTIQGVYLEGDVQMSRGEHYMRGDSAYYDFTTDRALIINPVLKAANSAKNIWFTVRAREVRELSPREWQFSDSRISTSDFYDPSYSIGAKKTYLYDKTPYDPKTGEKTGENLMYQKSSGVTMNLGSIPVGYLPRTEGDVEDTQTALRRIGGGKYSDKGWGGETEWDLFRLLGMYKPSGFKARLIANWYERGPLVGTKMSYERKNYSGYSMLYGMIDKGEWDTFGKTYAEKVDTDTRGRALFRHKHNLPDGWEMQFELSYLCDRSYLRQYFSEEYYNGKDQETLLYVKKAKDNWAITGLLQYRMNRFLSQGESWPDIAGYLIGQPLAGDLMTLFSEGRIGAKKYKYDNDLLSTNGNYEDSDVMARFDTRNEVDIPFKIGSVNIVPYVVGRETYWSDTIAADKNRLYGQVGVKVNTHIWRVYDNVESRLFDVHKLKHVITPEFTTFFGGMTSGSPRPRDLYPFNPDIEQFVDQMSGYVASVKQRLVTKRGPSPDKMVSVNWMRFDTVLGFFDNGSSWSDGWFDSSRPEYSKGSNYLYFLYEWNISDATAFRGDVNFDTSRINGDHTNKIDHLSCVSRSSLELAVQHDPRLKYLVRWLYLRDKETSGLTFGGEYAINDKYTLSLYELYDFDYAGGKNIGTRIGVTRKFDRWYLGVTFGYDYVTSSSEYSHGNGYSVFLSIWPEGADQLKVETGTNIPGLGESSMN